MSDNSVFITGAATGIGMALAHKLDQEGWTVFAGFNRTPPDELLAKASDRLTAMRVDVTDDEQVGKAAEHVSEAVGESGLRLLINNAAVTGAPGPVETVDIDEFKQVMEVNFWGPLRVTQAFLPLLRRHDRPRMIVMTSASVYLTIPLGCSYPTSKRALAALAAHLRMEMAPLGIEVTSLEAGGVETAMTAQPPEEEATMWASIPEHLIEAYQSAFTFPGAPIADSFELEAPESFADKVYRQVITTSRLKPVYTIGKGVAVLPIMERLLSKRGHEKAMRKLFRVKKPG